MKPVLFKILFGPLLLVQGWWVRMKTPKLPVPEFDQSGVVGEGQVLRLLLLGDSSAAGVGAEHAEQTLLAQLLKNLESQFQVHFQMMAESGRKSLEMLAVLAQEPPQDYDVIITALGVNDVTSQVPRDQWIKQQRHLIENLKIRNPKSIIMSGLPPVGDFPALPWPLNLFLGGSADVFDQALKKMCDDECGVVFHSLRNYPVTASCASDGFHPGPKTYEIWAEKLATEISAQF